MSLRSLHVSQFRQLADLQLDDLAPITLIGGRNGAGKTSLLECIYLAATELTMDKLLELEARRRQPGLHGRVPVPGSLGDRHGETPWDLLFPLDSESAKIELKYRNSESLDFELVLKRPDSSNDPLSQVETLLTQLGWSPSSASGANEFLVALTQCPRGGDHTHERIFTVRDGQPQSFDTRSGSEPAPHAIGAGGVTYTSTNDWAAIARLNDLYSEVRRLNQSEYLKKAVNAVDPRIQDMEILSYRGQLQLHAMTRLGTFPLSHAGDGAIRTATYAAAILSTPNGVVLIDEVENGLHYTALEALWKAIGSAAEAANTQVVLTTHSDECLTTAAKVLDAEGQLAYYRLDRAENERPVSATRYDAKSALFSLERGIPIR